MAEFWILGPLAAFADDVPLELGSGKQRALFAALLLERGEPVSVDRLIEALWGEGPPASAPSSVHAYVSRLRRSLGQERLLTSGRSYRLVVEPGELDLDRFERLLADGRKHLSDGDAAGARENLRAALDLWRGRPLEDFAYEPFAASEIARLEELHLAALEERIEADLTLGRHNELVPELQSLVHEHPLRERLLRQLMLALYRSGRQVEALEAFRQARASFVEELGLEPSPTLQQLEREILTHDPALEPPVAGARTREAPRIQTFLIADVRGYTLFTQDRGDEAAARLATKFARLARDAVEAAGGSVVELRGDEALAVFDSTRQAIRAAMELQAQFVEATIAEPTLPLAVGIGLDAGEAVPVDGGYRGGALNLAARLSSLAGPGEVLASQEVAHLARKVDGIRYVERGQIQLKGLAEEVHVVRVRQEGEDLADDTAFRRALGPMAASVAAPPGLETRNPYKGLRAFEEADAADFFGREKLTETLMARLAETRFLAVVGPSGSGKSSVVRAGLIPALRRGALPGSERWEVVEMFPGAYPLEELEAALLRIAANPPATLMEQLESGEQGLLRAAKRILPADGSELVLVIDQLEEAFTLVEDEGRRTHFLAIVERAVVDPRSRLRVVATLRADFYDRPLLYSGFAELLRDYVEAVVPLMPEEFERAISAPARAVGLSLESGLLAEMVADVADEPGGLPLLQYALTELYDRREGQALTQDAYRAIGGVSGALAGRAEELYSGLSESAQDATRQLFLRLVTLGEGTEDTRRRVDRGELASIEVDQEAMTTAIEVFGASRLLSFDRDPRTGTPTVEVAHEALLREWARLRRWIDAAREGVRMHRRLSSAGADWDQSDRDPSFLLRGSQLAQFESWGEESGLALTELERDYLRTSTDEREAERAAEEARSAHEVALERRSVNRMRGLVGVFAVAALVAAGLTVFAFRQSQHSKHEANLATGRQLTAASAANLGVDPQRSILLALQAVDTFRSTSNAVPREAVEAVHRAIEASRVQLTLRNQASKYVGFGPDGRLVATGGDATATGQGGEVVLWNARTGRRLLSLPRQRNPVGPDVRFSPDGSRLFAHVDGLGTVAWDTRTGKRILLLPDRGPLANLALSPDGTRIATTSNDGKLTIWNIRSRKRLRTIRAPSSLCGTSFSPDGTRVAAALCFGGTGGAWVWDVRSGRRLLAVGGPRYGWAFNVAYSPDGQRIVTVGNEGKGRVWDARSGRLLATLVGHTGWIWAARFSPDGRRIVTGSSDATARVWDSRTGLPLLVLAGHAKSVFDVAFSPDGGRVLTGSADGTARVWDVRPQGGRDGLTLPAHGGLQGALVVNYSPDGKLLATGGGGDTPASLWNASTGRKLRDLPHRGDVYAAAFSPDGRRILLSGDGTPLVVDTESGRVLRRLTPGADWQPAAAWSADGKLIALGLGDGPGGVRVRDARTGKLVNRFRYPEGVSELAFSPDGTQLAAAGYGTTAKLWDLSSHRLLATLSGHRDVVSSVAFSPDGRRLATGSLDATARIWDARSGRQLRTLQGPSGALWHVAFSPDGKSLATAGDDTTARLWDVATGKELLTLTGPTFALRWVTFNPGGTSLATASADGNVRVYILSLDQLMAVARSRLTRSWTTTECQEFLNSDHCPAKP